jgi:hypothetical protein
MGAPLGASINATTGVFTWLPSEAQGPGVYSLTVRVTDNGTPGLTAEETISVTIVNVTPTHVDAHGPYTGAVTQPVRLNGTANCISNDVCMYTWDMDNGGAFDDATGQTPSYTWSTPGSYTVRLQVTDDEGSAITDTAIVNIQSPNYRYFIPIIRREE